MLSWKRVVVVAALSCLACGKGRHPSGPAVPVEASVAWVEEGGREEVRFTVHTLPGARVTIRAALGGAHWPKEKTVEAGGDGLAILVVPPPRSQKAGDIFVNVGLPKEGRSGSTRLSPPSPPARLVARPDGSLECEDRSCQVAYRGAALVVSGPPGTRYRVGEHQGTIAGGGRFASASIPLDLAKFLGGVPLGVYCSGGPTGRAPDLAVRLELPGGTVTATWSLATALGQMFSDLVASALKAGVILPEEGKGKAIAFLDVGRRAACFGAPARLGDIDRVARRERIERRLSCGTYVRENKKMELPKRLFDVRLVLHDRRTGKIVEELVVKAPDRPCPKATEKTAEVLSEVAPAEIARALAGKAR